MFIHQTGMYSFVLFLLELTTMKVNRIVFHVAKQQSYILHSIHCLILGSKEHNVLLMHSNLLLILLK